MHFYYKDISNWFYEEKQYWKNYMLLFDVLGTKLYV